MSAPVVVFPAVARPEPVADRLPASVLRRLVAGAAIPAADWDANPAADRAALAASPDLSALAAALLTRRLLTPFQADRVRAGHLGGLVFGNYRLLDQLGAGRRGEAFRAEHLTLRRPAVVKVLHPVADRRALDRLFLEVRAAANLRHPAIPATADAGLEPQAGSDGQPLPYLVSELVPGVTLADLVARDGPLSPAVACAHLHAAADALADAHRHGLVHRGLTPHNLLIGADGRVRLLDFGVGRLPGPVAAGYTAPEVADPAAADARADVFALAACLRFAVADEPPPLLAAVLARMLAADPTQRTPTAAAAARELAPLRGGPEPVRPADPPPLVVGHRLLVVDDEAGVRAVCRAALASEPLTVTEVADGPAALDQLTAGRFDLVVLDVDLPGLDGERVLRTLRAAPPTPHLKVLMLSGRPGDELSRLLAAGADDYLCKPFSVVQLRARVLSLLRMKDAQDRADGLTRQLAGANAQLEAAVSAKADELVHARGAMVLALAKLVEQKSAESGGHLLRLQRYVRVLAEAAAATPAFAGRLDPAFVGLVQDVAPLHDIGKVGVPDAVLNKPGPLTPDEWRQMQQHTSIGADTLAEVASQYPLFAGFFATAVDVARSHHEKWDGTGYPQRLAGEAIPLAARLVAVGDVYDALRSRRVYKPGLSHAAAVEQMLRLSPGHFDPALVGVFEAVAGQFDRVFRETGD